MAVANDNSLLEPNNHKFGSEIRYQLKLYLQKLTEEEDVYLERAIGWGSEFGLGGRIARYWSDRLRLDKFRTEAEKYRADINKTSNLIKKILNQNNFLPYSENPDNLKLTQEIINAIETVIVVREEEQSYHRHILFLLGYCYLKGVIVRQDKYQGKILFDRAVKQGYGCPVNYYLNSVEGVIGKKLDWESRYELKFYLGQLQQELYLLETKTLELKNSSGIKKDADLISKNKKFILDIGKTLNWIKEILYGSKDDERNNKILNEMVERESFLLKLLDEEKQFHKYALFLKGFCFHRGIGVPQDDRKAWIYFESAAKQGLGKAQYYLAKYYLDGFMDMPSSEAEAEAIRIFMNNLDVPEVQLYRAQCYFKRVENLKKFDKFLEPAESVILEECTQPVMPDPLLKLAADYLILAISHGYAPALYFLSKKASGEMVQLAADQGWLPAMLRCGASMWDRHHGILRYQPFDALYYYQMAVDYGYHFAAIEIKDRIEALELGTNNDRNNAGLSSIAPYTPEVLGIIVYNGGIRVRTNAKPERYIQMAREGYDRYKSINPYLAFHLSLIYGYGHGVAKDIGFARQMRQAKEPLEFLYKGGRNIHNLYNQGVACICYDSVFSPDGFPLPEVAFNNFNTAYEASKKLCGVHAPDYDVVHNLRYCYETGCGVAVDSKMARELYEQNLRTDFDYDNIPEEQFQLVAGEMKIPFVSRKISDPEIDYDPKTASAATDISAVSASKEGWLSIHPVVKPMTPYYRQHCQAYFHQLSGNSFQSLRCAEQSVLQGNAASTRVVNRLNPIRTMLSGFDVLGRGFPLPLKEMMVEYVFDDGLYLRGMKLGPLGRPHKP